jgi:hypothetical protein
MFGTALAQITFGRISNNPIVSLGHHFLGADLDAFTAPDTTLRPVDSLGFNGYALWIVTPATGQWAALKKHRCTNTRPVMNGIFFDVKDDAFGHNHIPDS